MVEKLPPEVQQAAQELEELQERYLAIVNQRTLIESEISEIKRVLEHLKELPEGYKVFKNIGNVLFEESKEKVVKELSEKLELDELLLERYRKEEQSLKTQIQTLQEKLKDMIAKHYQSLATREKKTITGS
ncbi:MAG: prefoldin subunit beta [Fervidicoccaceae archaeon]|jgi:prefoldin beta subunit|nr:prefoldin subunit beta [Fervidicoccaceae archaeon]